jgi:PIN domain-containing protein
MEPERSSALTALLDANVLHPMSLCDLLLRLALDDFYRPLWSREILAETARSIHGRRPDLDPQRLARRMQTMEEAFPGALVEGYEAHLPSLAVLGKDAHVLAAAIAGDADVIVTSNLKDFPRDILQGFNITAVSPDGFLLQHWLQDPAGVWRVLLAQAAATKRPPLTVDVVLENLQPVAAEFVRLARASEEFK